MHNDDTDTTMNAPFAALRDATSALMAPPEVEKNLMAAFARHSRPRRWYQRLSAVQLNLLSCLGTSLAVLLVWGLLPHSQDQTAAPSLGFDEGALIAIASRERILQEPSPRLVQADLPRTILGDLGFGLTPENAGDTVRGQLLVGADGSALAFRFLSNP